MMWYMYSCSLAQEKMAISIRQVCSLCFRNKCKTVIVYWVQDWDLALTCWWYLFLPFKEQAKTLESHCALFVWLTIFLCGYFFFPVTRAECSWKSLGVCILKYRIWTCKCMCAKYKGFYYIVNLEAKTTCLSLTWHDLSFFIASRTRKTKLLPAQPCSFACDRPQKELTLVLCSTERSCHQHYTMKAYIRCSMMG